MTRGREDIDKTSAITRCYAKRHGGKYFLDVINEGHYNPEYNYFTSRWITLRDRYWDEAEWLIGADGDVIPIGFNRNVMDYLDKYTEADVVFHNRETDEVHASLVAFRTNSIFARCFLDSWIERGHSRQAPNYDNGDLLEVVLEVLAPELYATCKPIRDDYTRFIQCFAEVLGQYQRSTTKPAPIKILWPLEGFLREFNQMGDCSLKCYEPDVFVHGAKDLGETFSEDYLYSCTNAPTTVMLPACYNRGINVDAEGTLEMAKSCCFWHYSGCIVDGKNVCQESPGCGESVGDFRSRPGHCPYNMRWSRLLREKKKGGRRGRKIFGFL